MAFIDIFITQLVDGCILGNKFRVTFISKFCGQQHVAESHTVSFRVGFQVKDCVIVKLICRCRVYSTCL